MTKQIEISDELYEFLDIACKKYGGTIEQAVEECCMFSIGIAPSNLFNDEQMKRYKAHLEKVFSEVKK